MAGCMLLSNSVIQPCRTPTKQQLSQYWLLDRLPVICLSSHQPPRQSTAGQCHPTLTFFKKGMQVIFSSSPFITVYRLYFPPAILQCMPCVVSFFFQMSPIFHSFFFFFKSNLSDKPTGGSHDKVHASWWRISTLWQLKIQNHHCKHCIFLD